jgi:hypothetical protein
MEGKRINALYIAYTIGLERIIIIIVWEMSSCVVTTMSFCVFMHTQLEIREISINFNLIYLSY